MRFVLPDCLVCFKNTSGMLRGGGHTGRGTGRVTATCPNVPLPRKVCFKNTSSSSRLPRGGGHARREGGCEPMRFALPDYLVCFENTSGSSRQTL